MSIAPDANAIIRNMVRNANDRTRGTITKVYEGDDIVFPSVSLEPLCYGADKKDFGSHVAIVDNSDGRVITVATESYQLFTHEHFIEISDAAVKSTYGKVNRTTYMINGGDKMLVQYQLEDNPITLRSGDIAYPTLLLKNSYDLGWAASMMAGVFRLVCTNGAYVGELTKSKRKHTASLTSEYVKAVVDTVVNNIPNIEKRMTEWANQRIDKKTRINLDSLKLNEGEQQSLRFQRERTSGLHIDSKQIETADGEKTIWVPDAETTKYDLWNLMTEFATHRVTSAIRRDTINTGIDKLFHSNKLLVA